MWLFGAGVILLLGGIALVASGRGEAMAPAYDDRRDVEVPAAGPLSVEDLRRIRFTTALRGYRQSEVDALLARLESQLPHRTDEPVGDGADLPGEARQD